TCDANAIVVVVSTVCSNGTVSLSVSPPVIDVSAVMATSRPIVNIGCAHITKNGPVAVGYFIVVVPNKIVNPPDLAIPEHGMQHVHLGANGSIRKGSCRCRRAGSNTIPAAA